MTPLHRPFLIGAGLLSLCACGPDPDQLLTRARTELAAADEQAARLDLTQLLKARPDDRSALTLLAEVQIRLGDAEGAIATLDRLGSDPSPSLRLLRAEAELLRGKGDAALALLTNDDSAGAWRIRAGAALARGDQTAAIGAYEAGLKRSADPRLLNDYARLLISAEDYPAAWRLIARLRQSQPGAFATLLLEGDALTAEQRTGPATTAYMAAAKRAPRRIEPLLGLAALADAAGQDQRVEELVKSAAALAPEDPRVMQWSIQVAQLKGDWATVRAMLAPRESTLVARSPEGLAYAEALLNLGQPEQARALFRRALTQSPQNPYARLMLAEAELATGDARRALETVRPLTATGIAGERELELAERAAKAAGLPEASEFAQRRSGADSAESRRLAAAGAAAYARSDWAAATAAYQALSASAESGEVFRRLALSASKAGQHDLAIASADRALALQADNPDVLFAAGLARVNASRDRLRGLELLQAAVAADPANALFRSTLAKARSTDSSGVR